MANQYFPAPRSTIKKICKKVKKNYGQLSANPEKIYLEYRYEDADASGTGTLALDDEPTNAKLHTDRLLLWKDATLIYYRDLHACGIHKHQPRFRPIKDGQQLVTHASQSEDGPYHTTVKFLNSGTVVVESADITTWVERDGVAIRDLVDKQQVDLNRSLNNSSSCSPATSTPAKIAVPTAEMHDAQLSPPPAQPRSSAAARLSFTCVNRVASPPAPPQTEYPDAEARLSVSASTTPNSCSSRVAQSAAVADLCFSASSIDTSDTDSSSSDSESAGCSACSVLQHTIQQQTESISRLEKQLDAMLSRNLSLADACTQRRTEAEKLEATTASLREKLDSLQEERDMLEARIKSLRDITAGSQPPPPQVISNRPPIHPLPATTGDIPLPKPSPSAPSSSAQPPPPQPVTPLIPATSLPSAPIVRVYGTSMARGVTQHLRQVDVVASGSVHGGATVNRLIDELHREPKDDSVTHVVLLAGSNDLANGESTASIVRNTTTLLGATKNVFPQASLAFSGLHHRTDISDINRSIDYTNNRLRALCQTNNVTFIDNNSGSKADAPLTDRLHRDGLHLSSAGRKQLANRLASAIRPQRGGAKQPALASRQQPIPALQHLRQADQQPQFARQQPAPASYAAVSRRQLRPAHQNQAQQLSSCPQKQVCHLQETSHPQYFRNPLRDKHMIPALMDLVLPRPPSLCTCRMLQ